MRGIPAYIVMPENAPEIKKIAVAGYGAQITYCTPTLEARESTLKKVALQTGATEIHPYNYFNVICGQGTAAKELIEQTPAPGGDYSTQAFVEALGLPPFTLVGHSMGGRNSMAFTARYPDKVTRLIVVDIGPSIDPRGAERIKREIQAVPEAFDAFEDVVAYMSKQNRYASDAVLRRRLRYATTTLPDGKVGWRYDRAIREQSRNGTGAPAIDLWPELPKITCPTLIVRGAETDLLSPEVAQQMLETLPHAQLVEVQRAAHMVFEENPDGFIEAVQPYLQ
jgi:pimeloyl-ACP methyl ester carboxylesterase